MQIVVKHTSEYTMNGVFSVKSDDFSYETMMLEIISGKKNKWSNHSLNPVGFASDNKNLHHLIFSKISYGS